MEKKDVTFGSLIEAAEVYDNALKAVEAAVLRITSDADAAKRIVATAKSMAATYVSRYRETANV